MNTDQLEEMWTGDWRLKVRRRVRAAGCETISDYLDRHPSLPYAKLARALGPVAAVQLEILQFEEASDPASQRAAAADMLVRKINEHLKRGWGKGLHCDFNTAGVVSDWQTFFKTQLTASELVQLSEQVWSNLVGSRPPLGWLPKNSDDPLIKAAFETAGQSFGRTSPIEQPPRTAKAP